MSSYSSLEESMVEVETSRSSTSGKSFIDLARNEAGGLPAATPNVNRGTVSTAQPSSSPVPQKRDPTDRDVWAADIENQTPRNAPTHDNEPPPPEPPKPPTDQDVGSPPNQPVVQEVILTEDDKAKLFDAFQWTTPTDRIIIAIGVLAMCCVGAAMPLTMLVSGNSVSALGSGKLDVHPYIIAFSCLAAGAFLGGAIGAICSELTSEHSVRTLKEQFLRAVMRQEVGYWDDRDTGVLAADIEQGCVFLKDGTGMKFTNIFQFCMQFIAGYVIGMSRNWRMALVMTGPVPLLAGTSAFIITRIRFAAMRAKKNFEKASAVAEEAIPSIRTVAALGLEDHFASHFEAYLAQGLKNDINSQLQKAMSIAFMFLLLCSSYALGWWFGGRSVRQSWLDSNGTDFSMGGHVLTVFYCILGASFSLGGILPNGNALMNASTSTRTARLLIERASKIDPYDQRGIVIGGEASSSGAPAKGTLQGKIEFKNVRFAYPTRMNRPVYEDVSFTIEPGQTVALVGPSGCGKSTVIQLLERFYDPQGGEILIDGIKIQDYNLASLRNQMSLVSQEPKLFADTLRNNIATGAILNPGGRPSGEKRAAVAKGDSLFEKVPMDSIISAAKMSNAHDFITEFPDGYETYAGQGGSLLSGGQKQRIAIARAIIRNPSILLLDEATSALDNNSEKIVQKALDDVLKQRKRTTIIIAHRLSTIRHVDKILVIDNPDGFGSKVIEQGTHSELMKVPNGVYAGLVEAQTLILKKQADEQDESGLDFSDLSDKGRLGQLSKESIIGRLSREMNASAPIPEDFSRSDSIVRLLHKYEGGSKEGSRIMDRGNGSFGSRAQGSVDRPGSRTGGASVEAALKGVGPPVGRDVEEGLVIEKGAVRRIYTYVNGDWWVLLTGVVSSMCVGAMYPTLALLVSSFVGAFYDYDYSLSAQENADGLKDAVRRIALSFVGVAFAFMIVEFGQEFSFGYAGERLIARMRRLFFRSLLHQDMEFFDSPANGTGTLIAILSADCGLLRGVTGGNLSVLSQNTFTICITFVYAFVANAKLAAVGFACFCLLIPSGYIQNKLVRTTAIRPDALNNEQSAGFVMNEAILGLKTVTAYNLQDHMLDRYVKTLDQEYRNGIQNSFVTGFMAGFAACLQHAVNAILYYYGGKLVSRGEISLQSMMRVILVVGMAGGNVGRSVSWTTDSKKARLAARNILNVVERKPRVDARSEDGAKKPMTGSINFDHIKFRYTHRPEIPVLHDITFLVPPGKTVALVGASGSGKSTIIQLIERFYDVQCSDNLRLLIRRLNVPIGDKQAADGDPTNVVPETSPSSLFGGTAMADGTNLVHHNVRNLRSKLGLVSQEPVLFQGSVKENIRFGKPWATDDEIFEAAKAANCHDFIMDLPEGYDTFVGKGGSFLSGGQKQRVAIARALIRNPPVLLLDEATSALDPESEEVVQKALDALLETRNMTTIVIAHRLSTIRNADQIVVFAPNPGVGSTIVEVGNHQALMDIPDGIYRQLVLISENVAKA